MTLFGKGAYVFRAGGGWKLDELVPVDQVVLVIDDDWRGVRDIELLGDISRYRAAGGVDQVTEVASEHGGRRLHGVLREHIPAPMRFVGGEPEGLVAAIVDFGDHDGTAGSQGTGVVLLGGDGAVDSWRG